MEDRFYRDTWAEIDLDCIKGNIASIQALMSEDVKIMAIVKANGYGHGDIQTARMALASGASSLAVAFLDEAISLRKKGIEAPILVLGATRPEDVKVAVEYGISLTVFQHEWLKTAETFLDKNSFLSLHIKIDTGMGRIGLRDDIELKEIEALIMSNRNLLLEGVYTHFATADEIDDQYFRVQQQKFNDMLSVLTTQPHYIHCSNSAASLMYPEARFNAVRIGIAMYGLTPSIEIEHNLPIELNEAFSLHTRLIHVKKLNKGEKVSYGATYTAGENEWIGTLPIGYADGWIRKLQGQDVLIEGERVPIVGRICMDQCMIRLPRFIPIGTKVTLIGKQNKEFISVNEVAQKLETINYEVPCMISERVPRVYKYDGQTVNITNGLLDG